MRILGIESSCDDCAVAVVEDGRRVLSSVVSSQNDAHAVYNGVVPELASRLHTEHIVQVYRTALADAGLGPHAIDAVAVTSRPGLIGSLLVGLSFAKALAFSRKLPLLGVDHVMAHLYAPRLEQDIPYPHLGLLVSGGHTLLALVRGFDDVEVLGTTVDDAVGEAFDKVAKHLGLGYPGGKAVDELARKGDAQAFAFPKPRLGPSRRKYDLSFSGLKTAVVNQRNQFLRPGHEPTLANVCASFQRTAVEILVDLVKSAAASTGVNSVVAAGGVASNSLLRASLDACSSLKAYYPSFSYCTDNGAMVAGLAYHHLLRGERSGWDLNAESRVPALRALKN
ncbi:MAG: tRNA (adenosine(37)-N6)-threonylcarbamoyltransferase complex transferase subunit TsaD [Spirochaetales bacterium]|nr:tRNA (adenosine(37)-N6)-threonylcarbamoyltransferase complex transferase subunit TsaD [Spirochaetales bacterium]